MIYDSRPKITQSQPELHRTPINHDAVLADGVASNTTRDPPTLRPNPPLTRSLLLPAATASLSSTTRFPQDKTRVRPERDLDIRRFPVGHPFPRSNPRGEIRTRVSYPCACVGGAHRHGWSAAAPSMSTRIAGSVGSAPRGGDILLEGSATHR